MLIPTEKIIIQALAHETRRAILRLLQTKTYSFSELMTILDIPSGKLNYHLSQIAGFIQKDAITGEYMTTSLGEKIIDFLNIVPQTLKLKEIPYLCEAHLSQMTGKEQAVIFNKSYLSGNIQAVQLFIRLIQVIDKRGDYSSCEQYLRELEKKIYKIVQDSQESQQQTTVQSKHRRILLQDFWHGVHDTIKHIQKQDLKNKAILQQYLKRLNIEGQELQHQLTEIKDIEEGSIASILLEETLPQGIQWLIDSLLDENSGGAS